MIWFKMLVLMFCFSVISFVKSTIYQIFTERLACADTGQEMERRIPVCCLSGLCPAEQTGYRKGWTVVSAAAGAALQAATEQGRCGEPEGPARRRLGGLACPLLSRTHMPEALP